MKLHIDKGYFFFTPGRKYVSKLKFWLLLLMSLIALDNRAQLTRSKLGESVVTNGGDITITCIDQRRGFGKGSTYDADIQSPKSASFSHDGKKIYINSLEGGKTVVYDAATRKKLKIINHEFTSGTGDLWLSPSGFYEFTHYPQGETRSFMGKPVEEAMTLDGRYLFVPYYRRSFDLNAQDPSALAIIDTRTDEIVKMVETGPLPKMVRVSHNGKLLAITHWGDNTVGFLDISDPDPAKWHHLPPVTIGKKLNLNYSLTSSVNRDSGSGFLLRGTVFLPGDSLLLVSGMAGPLNVIDVKKMTWLGTFPDLGNIRHLTLNNQTLYMSRNSAGEVLTVPVDSIVKAIATRRGDSRIFKARGVKRAKVDGGARTLKVSPSGKYIFVACNTGSALNIVRTEDMKVIGSIETDSYPVGLDISPDGTMIVTTSQGRKGKGGGNAVNFFKVEYKNPEPILYQAEEIIEKETISEQEPSKKEVERKSGMSVLGWIGIGLAIACVVILTFLLLRRRHP